MADINSAAKEAISVNVPKSAPSADPIWKLRVARTVQPKTEAAHALPQPHESNNLPSDPTQWPEEWRYEFMERSGMLFNTGVTLEEADKTAEALVREHHAHVSRNGQLLLLDEDPL